MLESFAERRSSKMKYSNGPLNPRLVIVCVALVAFVSLPFLSSARTVSTSVNIVNNSTREIRNVYSSHVDADDWSADLLGDNSIAAGQSSTLSSVACDGQQVKLIAEDQDGCFLSVVVTCGDNATWTITNDTARDCGF
jgi:hypothetical protein